MKKYYAVRVGRETGVFNTWTECKKNIYKYPSAVYKSFLTYEDANDFILGQEKENKLQEDQKADMVAYIDGSYDNSLKRYGYGVIVFYNDEKYLFSDSEDDPETVELRNVAGELKAAMWVMNYAKEQGVYSLAIYYDYAGIENWARGIWKTNLEFTRDYAKYSKEIMKDIDIYFNKVKAHTGDKYNEEVDKLARDSIRKYLK